MVMALILLGMAIHTKGSFRMGNLKGEEATIGLKMAQAMLGNSKEVSSMVRANGRVEPARQP